MAATPISVTKSPLIRRFRVGVLGVLLVLGVHVDAFAQSAPVSSERIRMAGSDLLAGGRVEDVLNAHAADYGQSMSLTFVGSRLARDRIAVGLIDFAVVVDYPGAAPLPEGWMTATIGYLATVVVAPARVSVDHISYTDLARVFSVDSSQANLRWGELGGRGEWVGMPVRPMATSAAGGLAEPIFRQVVLGDGAVKAEIPRFHRNEDTLQAARAEEGALAIVTMLPADDTKLKALLVQSSPEHVAFGPTAENLHAGDYPLRLPVQVVFERKRMLELLPLLRLWHGVEMAEALEAKGVVPLPASARSQQVFDLEVLE